MSDGTTMSSGVDQRLSGPAERTVTSEPAQETSKGRPPGIFDLRSPVDEASLTQARRCGAFGSCWVLDVRVGIPLRFGMAEEGATRLSMWVVSRSGTWIIMAIFVPIFFLLPAALVMSLSFPALGPVPTLASVALMLACVGGVLFEAHGRVTVARDGILVRHLWRSRFVPFTALLDAREVDGVLIRLALRDGSAIDVYTGKAEQAGKEKYARACDVLLARIREGIASTRGRVGEGGIEERNATLRERAQRTLHGIPTRQRRPYRETPAPNPDELMRIVESAEARPVNRAAAAVLVGQAGDETARKRLRVAAEDSANPKLQRLFRVAADERDPASVEQALAELDGEEAEPAAAVGSLPRRSSGD